MGKGHEREQGVSLDSTVNQIWPGSLRKTWQKVCYRWAMGIRSSLWPLVSVRSVGKILFSHTGQVTQKSLYPLDISIFITQTGRKKTASYELETLWCYVWSLSSLKAFYMGTQSTFSPLLHISLAPFIDRKLPQFSKEQKHKILPREKGNTIFNVLK